MNTSMPYRKNEPGISPAASAALEELLAGRRSEVLYEASRISRGSEVSAADVIRAYHSNADTDVRRAIEMTETFELSRNRARRRLFNRTLITSVMIIWVFALGTILWLAYSDGRNGEAGPANDPILVTVLGLMAGTVTALSSIIAMRRSEQKQSVEARDQQMLRTVLMRTQGDNQYDLSEDASRLGNFVKRWSLLENQLRELAYAVGIDETAPSSRRRPIGSVITNLARSGVLSDELFRDIRIIVSLRNRAMHFADLSAVELEEGLDKISRVTARVDSLVEDHT